MYPYMDPMGPMTSRSVVLCSFGSRFGKRKASCQKLKPQKETNIANNIRIPYNHHIDIQYIISLSYVSHHCCQQTSVSLFVWAWRSCRLQTATKENGKQPHKQLHRQAFPFKGGEDLGWDLEQIHTSERLCFYPFCELRSNRTIITSLLPANQCKPFRLGMAIVQAADSNKRKREATTQAAASPSLPNIRRHHMSYWKAGPKGPKRKIDSPPQLNSKVSTQMESMNGLI